MTCKMCGHTWYTRTGHPPKSCPKCGSARWNRVSVTECPICCACPVHNPHPTPTPTPAPALAPPVLVNCPRCGFAWNPRKDSPKQCPKCKARLDAGAGGKAALHAKIHAARAMASMGPLAPLIPSSFYRAIYDWTGRHVGSITGTDKVIRDDHNETDYYPVLDGGFTDANDRWIEPHLVGWIRREDVTPR